MPAPQGIAIIAAWLLLCLAARTLQSLDPPGKSGAPAVYETVQVLAFLGMASWLLTASLMAVARSLG